MKKRLVFDVDNTLIMWKSEYLLALRTSLERLEIEVTEELVEKIDKAIESYEYYHNICDMDRLLDLINRNIDIILPAEFMEYYIEEIGKCAEEADEELIETLDYLHGKYELVILTNWFRLSQIKRLEKCGIKKYFSEIHCGDDGLMKPDFDSYSRATIGRKPHECIMIGDNVEHDVKGALKYGMGAILCNFNNRTIENNEYVTINKITQLKEIF